MRLDELERHLRQVLAKAETGQSTTAEDVHLAARLWMVADQPDEAAAGHTTGADVRLATAVRANRGGGDAAAQTVCDAARVWRANTRLDRGPEPGPTRRLLAVIVDHHNRSWWRRNRTRVAMALVFAVGFGIAASGMTAAEGWGPRWVQVGSVAVTLVFLLSFAAVAADMKRASRR